MGDLRTIDLASASATGDSLTAFEVRPVEKSDTEALAVLYLDSYPAGVGAADIVEARAEIDATFGGEFGELRRDASFVGLIDGEPAGAILTVAQSIWDEGLTGPFVIDFFVAPHYRGRRLGRALLAETIRVCRAAGDRTLSLRVGEGTAPAAHRLYESAGFVEA